MKKTSLIMAGGKGERFWPKSRTSLPKQFLSLTDNALSMLQLTVERILPIIDMEDIFIVTNSNYKNLVHRQLPDLPERNIICEPAGRNTAPCIGLGAMYISKKYSDATMFVLPSDHLIKDQEMFLKTLTDAYEIANSDSNLVTLGITPNYPETGYGYIKYTPSHPLLNGYAVDQFVEKPNASLAAQYIADGSYLWNSGMFIWNISTILSNMKQLIPDTYNKLCTIRDAIDTSDEPTVLNNIFTNCKSESIDYAVMEHADNIYTIPGNFGWDDVGSWLALERHNTKDPSGNIKKGDVISVDTQNCIISSESCLIATLGIKDLIIVDGEDSVLICSKDKCNNIKDVLDQLKSDNSYCKYL